MFDSRAANVFVQEHFHEPPTYKKVVNLYIFDRASDPDEFSKLESYGFPSDLNGNNYYAILHLLTEKGHEMLIAIKSPTVSKFILVPCKTSLNQDHVLQMMKNKIDELESKC